MLHMIHYFHTDLHCNRVAKSPGLTRILRVSAFDLRSSGLVSSISGSRSKLHWTSDQGRKGKGGKEGKETGEGEGRGLRV